MTSTTSLWPLSGSKQHCGLIQFENWIARISSNLNSSFEICFSTGGYAWRKSRFFWTKLNHTVIKVQIKAVSKAPRPGVSCSIVSGTLHLYTKTVNQEQSGHSISFKNLCYKSQGQHIFYFFNFKAVEWSF